MCFYYGFKLKNIIKAYKKAIKYQEKKTKIVEDNQIESEEN
jgi:hypothetical protein